MMYLFICQCSACTQGEDRFRGIRCDACDRGTCYLNQTLETWKCEICENQNPPKALVSEKLEIARLEKCRNITDVKILEVEISRSQKIIGVNHAVPRLLQSQVLKILINGPGNFEKIERLALALKKWSPESVPTPLIISSILGRAGRFQAAADILEIARSGYEIIYPPECSQRRLLDRTHFAIEAKNSSAVPDLCTS